MQNLTRGELRTLRALDTPVKIQRFLDGLTYNGADTCYSPRLVLRTRRAHCLEGALVAAAALRLNGRPPLLLDLEAVNDTDHVLAIFRERGVMMNDLFVGDYVLEHQERFLADMAGWVADGRVKYREDIRQGVETIPDAFAEMMRGGNFGKMLVQVGEDPTLS